MTTETPFHFVGGFLRDEAMGLRSKDIDLACEADSLAALVERVENMGAEIFKIDEGTMTVRAKVPADLEHMFGGRDLDFVVCRSDGPTVDGRRPSFTVPGTLAQDLARRDFTINAMARRVDTGELIDPHGGAGDCRNKVLRFVGDPMDRIAEDGLRIMRGLRFIITKGLVPDAATWSAMVSREGAEMLMCVSGERIVNDELPPMFKHDTAATVCMLAQLPAWTRDAIMRPELSLKPSWTPAKK